GPRRAGVGGSVDPRTWPVTGHTAARLGEEADVLALFEGEVPKAAIVVVKLHGGVKSLPGFARLAELAERHDAWFVAMSGTDELDPELTAHSTAGVAISHEAKAYLQLGGLENYRQCLAFLCDHLLATGIGYERPLPQPRTGVYHPRAPSGDLAEWRQRAAPDRPTIGITFYRSYWVSGDTDFVDTLVEAGEALGANVLPIYAYSLKDEAGVDGV